MLFTSTYCHCKSKLQLAVTVSRNYTLNSVQQVGYSTPKTMGIRAVGDTSKCSQCIEIMMQYVWTMFEIFCCHLQFFRCLYRYSVLNFVAYPIL